MMVGRTRVDHDLIRTGRRVARADPHVAAQADVRRHAGAEGRRTTAGQNRLAGVVGQQRVPTDVSGSRTHAWHGVHLIEDIGRYWLVGCI
jgi:hypothetical protein